MESIWRLQRHWRPFRNRFLQDKALVHLCFFSHAGFAHRYLYDSGVLDELKKIHLAA